MRTLKDPIIRLFISVICTLLFILLATVSEYNNYISDNFLNIVVALGAENTVLPSNLISHTENNPKSKHNKIKDTMNSSYCTWFINRNCYSAYSTDSALSLLSSLYSNVRGCFQRFCQLEDIPPPFLYFS